VEDHVAAVIPYIVPKTVRKTKILVLAMHHAMPVDLFPTKMGSRSLKLFFCEMADDLFHLIFEMILLAPKPAAVHIYMDL